MKEKIIAEQIETATLASRLGDSPSLNHPIDVNLLLNARNDRLVAGHGSARLRSG